ncbi:MAG: TonB-dependent receptor [Prevotellaceae bacterium]|nr:TonB-dependent receptor [Prevotellaceae bacterium]
MHLLIRRALLALCMPMIGLVAYAQQAVSGVVKDANGEPLIGVTVMVDGKAGAITDMDGNFKIPNASASSTIKVSYIGYKDQTITVGNRSQINIVMEEDNATLDEVVVVGYGTMKKSDLTGSVSSVDTERLNAKGAPSVMENLQGSVPGVNITQSTGRTGGSFDIEIRGKSSTNSDLKPLYVVDGIICDDIDFLNPQDIERIDVLKDASSTAIYGSRATAGVIMVTTKSGTTVDKKMSKPTISYDGYYGISTVARMPDFMDGQQFYNYRFQKFLGLIGTASSPTSGTPVYGIKTQALYAQMALMNPNTGELRMKSLLESGDTYDWPSMVTQDGHQQNHYLAVSGSTERLNYHIGVGYASEEGIYKGDEQDKINFKGSLDGQINKYISAGFSFNLARIENDYASDEAVKYAYRMNPFAQPYDENGDLNLEPGAYGAMGTETSDNQFTNSKNPLLQMQNEKKNRETWKALGNIYLQINPIAGLTLKTTFSPNFSYYRQGHYLNDLDSKDEDTKISAEKTTQRAFEWTWDNTITYDKMFGKDHHINVMGLFSMSSANTETQYLNYLGVMDDTYWWNLNTGSYNADDSYNSYSESSMMSYALRANYSYKDRYMLTATVRWDGSSKFTDGNRWGSFPSVAFAWRVTEEEFMAKTSSWLSNLKLRLSYGVTGNNRGIGNYDTQVTTSGPVYYPFGSTTYNGYYPSGIVNAMLKWEKSHEFNVGLDFGFLNERIRGSVDWYTKKSKDLLYDVLLPLEAGGITMTTNIGSVRNTGIEIALTTENIVTKDWRWTTTFTFSHNKNEVLEINGLGGNYYSGSATGNLFVGEAYNNVYGYEWAGIVSDKMITVPNTDIAIRKGFTPGTQVKSSDYYYACYGWVEGNPIIVDRNGDGTIGEEDKKIYNSDPKWTGSFTTTLSYKNWDLSATLYAKMDYTVVSPFYAEYLGYNDRGRMKLYVDNYIPAGTLIDCDGINDDGTYINPVYQESTHYGSYPFVNNGAANSGLGTAYWLDATNSYVDASYVKVKNITLGYTFPKAWLKKIGCQKLRVYCTVTNPFVFTDYKGFDPEWADTSLKNDGPSTVTWQFGANIKF